MFPSVRSSAHVLIAAALLFLLAPGTAPAQIYFDTHEGSRIWLEGSSTVHRFDCVARSIQGTAFIEGYGGEVPAASGIQEADEGPRTSGPDAGTDQQGMVTRRPGSHPAEIHLAGGSPAEVKLNEMQQKLHVLLKIPVKSFDCGRSRMNRDMYEALKSDKYDYITFEFENARSLERSPSVSESLFDDGYQPFQIDGVLNVAGVDRNVTLLVRGRPEGEGRYRILGQKEISMQDFEIDPPTALRGLIRAHDDLTVFFDLHVLEKNQD